MLAFIIWLVFGCFFIGYGIYSFNAEKALPLGFWANAEVFPVEDIKAYNRAMGKLWIVFGIVLSALGIPLLSGQNSFGIIFSILGGMAEAIITMAVYVTVIEKKYRRT